MQQITLDLVPSGVRENAYASQYDIGRTIRFNLKNGGATYTLTGAETVTMRVRKPDGTERTEPITNTSSTYVDWTTINGTCDLDGLYDCELVVMNGSVKIGSANFTLNAEVDPYSGKVVVKMATGNPVHFETDLGGAVIDCKCNLPYNADGYTSATVINTSSSPVLDQLPYLFRASHFGGDRETDKLVGGTVAFNQLVQTTDTSITVTSGHKYLSKINNVQTIAISDGTAISINDGTEDNVHDLTLMFGSTIADYIYSLEQGTAGAGVAWFRNLFPKSYYAYNAGALKSVQTSKHITVGRNAFNPETGKAKLLGGNKYQLFGNYTSYSYSTGETITLDSDDCFTPSENGELTIVGGDSTTTFVGLYWDGEYDRIFAPYVKHEYDLSGSRLVHRVFGIVDLGLFGYTYSGGRFYASMDDNLYNCKHNLNSVLSNSLVTDFVQDTRVGLNTNTNHNVYSLCESTSSSCVLNFKNTDYTDTTQFKNYMMGKYLIYELKTPFDETVSNPELRGIPMLDSNNKLYYYGDTCEDFTNPQIVDDFGTEEYVDTREVPIPVGHETIYGNDMTVAKADFGTTVYGGSIDFTTGELISDKNADGTSKTPETISVTPKAVNARSGENYIITDADGSNSVKYFDAV